MNSILGTYYNIKFRFNESTKDFKKNNKSHGFLKLGAILIASVIIMAASNLPASQASSLLLTVPVGIAPNGITFDSNSGNVYVANYGDNTVSVINGATDAVNAMIVGTNPIAVTAGNGNIYVTNFGANTVSVISGTSVIATIPVGIYPYGIAAGNGNVYVGNFGSNNVSVINEKTNSVTATIPVGSYPSSVAFDSANGNAYVASFGNNNVSVINGTTNSVTATIPVGANPYGIAAGNGNVYTANYASNNVSVINGTTNSVTNTLNGVTNPLSLAFDSADGNLYVVSSVTNSVSIFSTSDPVIITPPPTPDPTSTGGSTGDTIAPVFVTMPSNIEIFPTSTLGAIATYNTPTATDNSGITPTITCDHSSGDLFSIGTTPVTCIAIDAANNKATASFNVKVYTPFEASQKIIDQLNGLGVLKSGTITSLTAKLPYSVTMIPGNNWGAKNTLNNFINEINSKCCSSVLNLLSSKPFTQDQATMFTTEARDIVAATP